MCCNIEGVVLTRLDCISCGLCQVSHQCLFGVHICFTLILKYLKQDVYDIYVGSLPNIVKNHTFHNISKHTTITLFLYLAKVGVEMFDNQVGVVGSLTINLNMKSTMIPSERYRCKPRHSRKLTNNNNTHR